MCHCRCGYSTRACDFPRPSEWRVFHRVDCLCLFLMRHFDSSGPLNFAQRLIAVAAQVSLLCQIIKVALQPGWTDEGGNGSPSAVPWMFACACLAQASGVTQLMSSILLDSAIAGVFHVFMQRVN